jgi:SAM-dependent methyltransferase
MAPWEKLASLPAAAQLDALLDDAARRRTSPLGKALDIGCGNGGWTLRLAERGWQVTGVDIVPKALRAARERAERAGLDARFIHCDVTALDAATLGEGFQLFLDLGTTHGLTQTQRVAVGHGVTALAAPDAALIMYAYAPGRRRMLPDGASRADIAAAYPGWRITDELIFNHEGLPASVVAMDPRWYRLRRG